MPFGVGQWELLVLGAIFVLFFGTSRLPRIGRDLGRSLREMRETVESVDPRSTLGELGRGEQPQQPGAARRPAEPPDS